MNKYLPLLAIALTGCTTNVVGWEVKADIAPVTRQLMVAVRSPVNLGAAVILDADNLGVYYSGRVGNERANGNLVMKPDEVTYDYYGKEAK